MKHAEQALQRAAGWAGVELSAGQLGLLTDYADWLVAEAIPAGALGPAEATRIIDRHVADSLVFGRGWMDQHIDALIDVGSGVGLPGIPLAIAYPGVAVTLLDRSERRTLLAARAVRILSLTNVVTVRAGWGDLTRGYGAATFRAAMPVGNALHAARSTLDMGGTAVIALSRSVPPDRTPAAEPGETIQLLETPEGILDSPAWHLRMTRN
ncbi:MAG: 16S rRNA (guanine(527)-N(7))-methyltransferase RsmG [Acidimicrobiia bacterium]|nr:MAG: 16S rRNA (guanine(527)-N(7))-methyltransferase RsmG [Acidimicrobiia bacterium]